MSGGCTRRDFLRLAGVGALRTRFDVSRARGLTRFVGRDADMFMLDTAGDVYAEAKKVFFEFLDKVLLD